MEKHKFSTVGLALWDQEKAYSFKNFPQEKTKCGAKASKKSLRKDLRKDLRKPQNP